MDYSIVIANWNGEAFLSRALGALEAAMKAAPGKGELIVVDDRSRDDSVSIVESGYPFVRLLENPENVGFAETVNRGLREATAPLAILLNNDIVVRNDFVGAVLEPFRADAPADLFAVSAKTIQWTTGEANHVRMNGRWRRGWIEKTWSDPPSPASALFVQAGACALDRRRALELGGLRRLYRPGYWEDYDLSYRAARRGWPSLYHPGAVAYHLGRASFERRYGAGGVRAMRLRNELLFMWSNLDDAAMIRAHAAALVRRTTGDLVRGRFDTLKAFAKALARLGEVRALRRGERGPFPTPDAALLRGGNGEGARVTRP